jgi:hypothetical protein
MDIKEHTINNYKILEYNKTSIFVVENILDDAFCDTMIKFIDNIPLLKMNIGGIQNVACYNQTIFNIKTYVDKIYYLFPLKQAIQPDSSMRRDYCYELINTETLFLNGITIDYVNDIENKITARMKVLNDIFNQINSNINLKYNSGYGLRKVYGETKLHIDSVVKMLNNDIISIDNDYNNERVIRNSSVIFTLNSDYDGGIFKFPYQDVSIKLKKGSVIIFPPYWTHPHLVTSVENNTFRYTINTWSCEPVHDE